MASMGAPVARHILRFYPPLLGAGIRPTKVDRCFREIDIEMPLTIFNRNYVGTHFGGSLYAMCDPFFMLMVMENLGKDYVVWDKSATIDFLKPGKGTVTARFRLSEERLREIREEVEKKGKCHPQFEVIVTDQQGQAVARVGKTLSVKKRVI